MFFKFSRIFVEEENDKISKTAIAKDEDSFKKNTVKLFKDNKEFHSIQEFFVKMYESLYVSILEQYLITQSQ